ncbi:MAG: hypothetical protein SR1Q5_09895 [Quinella sp. 1Q5]|nr:hypothetical protein [Quinella sp. 1Q5]
MKKFIFALLAVILFAATAQAAQPVRIARLPIIFLCSVPDSETCAALETKIQRAIHIPLNGTLQLADYLPENHSAQALNDIWNELRSQNKKAKLAEAIRPLASKIDADIVVCPVLRQYGQYASFFSSWNGDIYINSYAEAELIVFDRRTDILTDKKASRMYHDIYTLSGTASHLAKECFDKIIAESKLRDLIRAIR